MATVNPSTKPAQIRLARQFPADSHVTFDNPPIKVMGPFFLSSFRKSFAI